MPTQGAVAQSNISPWAVQDRVNAQSGRYALNTILMPRADLSYVDYRSGVMLSGDSGGTGTNNDLSHSTYMAMRVQAVAPAAMQVTVEMGNCVINTSGQGAYMACLDSTKTLNIAASGSTTRRIDLVIARIYDDENATIGSSPGVRKFTVEVYQGDATSGTPAVPSPNFFGYIPLAQIYVDANVSTITAANITDLRGPGLATRGGTRGLFEADAELGSAEFAEAGAHPGERRWVHGNSFPDQVWHGAGVDPNWSGWRGVNNQVIYQTFCTEDFGWVTEPEGYNITLCSMLVPYPGTPFNIYPTARAMMRCSRNVCIDMRINVTDTGTGQTDLVNWDRIDMGAGTVSSNTDQWNGFNCPPLSHGPHNADVHVWVEIHNYRIPVSNASWRLDRYWETMLQCTVQPAISPVIYLPNEG